MVFRRDNASKTFRGRGPPDHVGKLTVMSHDVAWDGYIHGSELQACKGQRWDPPLGKAGGMHPEKITPKNEQEKEENINLLRTRGLRGGKCIPIY